MPKKPPKNSYFFFMLEYKKFQEATGRRFPGGMKEVADEASEPWKKLSPVEKQRYEQIAKVHKAQDKKYGERYTSQGKALSEVYKEEEEKKKRVEDAKHRVMKLINDAVARDQLETTTFYILSFNYFTKETSHIKFFPAELGLVKFNIKSGISLKFHKLLNPGPLPLGHAFIAQDHADKTHKLPTPPKALGETEFDLVLGEMIEIFHKEPSGVGDKYPVLVMEEEQEMIEAILHEFCEKAELDYDSIQILPLTFFFHKFRSAIDKVFLETESQFSFAIAQAHLERDNYQYYSGHGCKLHELEDVNIHCALSRPTRWAYYIIDQAIGITGGKKRVGFHYPKGCVIEGDDSSEEDEEPQVKQEDDHDTRDQYSEMTDLKEEKSEFSDEEETRVQTTNRSLNPFHAENFPELGASNPKTSPVVVQSPVAHPWNGWKTRVIQDRSRYLDGDDTESTITSVSDVQSKEEERDRFFRGANNNEVNRTNRSTNPFHKENFPELGAVPKMSSRKNESYRRLGASESDSNHSSDRRSEI